jgi:hypothetical protein
MDIVTNANPAPRNPDTVSSKDSKDSKEVKAFKETKETADRSTTSNNSSKQSQGTSNSCPIILATRPPLNLAKPAQPYAGETPAAKKAPADTTQTDKKADADTKQTETGTSTSQPKDAVVDEKTKGATPQSGATAAGAAPAAAAGNQGAPSQAGAAPAPDKKSALEIDAQAVVSRNQSPNHQPSSSSLDVSGSAVWKKNGPEGKVGSGQVTIVKDPQVNAQVSVQEQDRNPSDPKTPGARASVHPQVQVGAAIFNYTNGKYEAELDAAVQADLRHPANPQFQAGVQAGVTYHINEKWAAVGQVSASNGGNSASIGVKVQIR